MKKVPENLEAAASGYSGPLSAQRQKELIDHIKSTPSPEGDAHRQAKTAQQIIANGGDEGAFVAHLLGQPAAREVTSPNDKKISAPHTK